MRYLSALSLVTLLLPSLIHPDEMKRTSPNSHGNASACRLSEEAINALNSGSSASIRGQLLVRGVTVGSKDGSISSRSLAQAIGAWNQSIPEQPFRLARADEVPDINVQKLVEIQEDIRLQGQIEIEMDVSGALRANIEISGSDRGQALSDVAIGAVLTHEMGHFVGLDDSLLPDASGAAVMGDFDPDHLVLYPSPEEIEAVQALRTDLLAHLDS